MYQTISTQIISYDRAPALALLFGSMEQAVSAMEQLVELNVQTLKTSLSEQQALTDATLSRQSLNEVIEVQSQFAPAVVRKQVAYWRHFGEVFIRTQSEMGGLLRDYAERSAAMRPIVAEVPSAASTVLLPDAIANTVDVSNAATGATPVTIVDGSGNAVSSNGPDGAMH
jgi:phasin family protein